MKFDLAWLRRRRVERDLDAEITDHLRARAAALEASGLAPSAAARGAQLEFGRAEAYRDEARNAAGTLSLETLLQDLSFGLRLLRKSPGFTLTAALMLALGIGANATIFSMADWLLLRPLPVHNSGELAYLVAGNQTGGFDNGFSYPNYTDMRVQSGAVFTGLAGVAPFQMDGLTVQGRTTSFWSNYVSGNFFSLLGVEPALGRFFQPGEGESVGAPGELVLSYDFWQSRFGGQREVIGESAAVNGRPVRIVGVAPRGFHGVLEVLNTQGFLTFSANTGGEFGQTGGGDFFTDRRSTVGLIVFGRRRAGISLAGVQPALQVIGTRLAAQYPRDDPWRSLYARQLSSEPLGANSGPSDPLRLAATLFLVLAGLLLLLACVNIANLLLARAAGRGRELAVRAALGAGRYRLLRQMLIESLLLGLLGGSGGLLIALAACHGLNAMPLGTAIPITLAFALSWRVFLYTLLIALGAGVAVGMAPAWKASRLTPAAVLHNGARAGLGGRARLRSALVVAEIGGSLALLIVAGLFTRSLNRVQRLDLGFAPAPVVNLSFDAHEAGLSQAQAQQLYDALLARVAAQPGVVSAALAASVPFGYYTYGSALDIPGYKTDPNHKPFANYNAVTPEYFTTMGVRLLRGRGFRAADTAGTPHVAIINTLFAQRFWPHADPIGRSFAITEDPTHPLEIIGIVAPSYTDDLESPLAPYIFLPLAQRYRAPVTLQIRTAAGDPTTAIPAARAAITALAPSVPVFDVAPMSQAIDSLNGVFLYKLGAGISLAMGLTGLFMALIGVYGVVAYNTSQRTSEIGVRLALGASRDQILRLILRQGARLAALGLVLGLLLAAAISPALRNFLTGVSPYDPWTWLSAALLLALVALAASLLPALRALRTDPATALRRE